MDIGTRIACLDFLPYKAEPVLLTQITLNQMANRGFDLRSPAPILEVRWGGGLELQHRDALVTLFQPASVKEKIVLSTCQLRALLDIEDMVVWSATEDASGDIVKVHPNDGSYDNLYYWENRYHYYFFLHDKYRNFEATTRIDKLIEREHKSRREEKWVCI